MPRCELQLQEQQLSVVQLPVEGAQLLHAVPVTFTQLNASASHFSLTPFRQDLSRQINLPVNLPDSPLLSFTLITMPGLGTGLQGWSLRQQLRTWATMPGSLLRGLQYFNPSVWQCPAGRLTVRHSEHKPECHYFPAGEHMTKKVLLGDDIFNQLSNRAP